MVIIFADWMIYSLVEGKKMNELKVLICKWNSSHARLMVDGKE